MNFGRPAARTATSASHGDDHGEGDGLGDPVAARRALAWQRLDTAGTDLALVDDRNGLVATGSAIVAEPVPYALTYRVATDAGWASTALSVRVEGAGWRRRLDLRRGDEGWRVTTHEDGDLDDALRAAGRPPAPFPGTEDPDRLADARDARVAWAPLFITLPVRRLRLAAGSAPAHAPAVLVVLPSLAVVRTEPVYRVGDDSTIELSVDGRSTTIGIDADGFVTHWPGTARRVGQ